MGRTPENAKSALRRFILVCLCTVLPLTAHSQVPAGSITGTVHDSDGRSVWPASVSLDQRKFVTNTDSSGRFTISKVPVGEHTIRVVSFRSIPFTSARLRVIDSDTLRLGTLTVRSIFPRQVWLGCDASDAHTAGVTKCMTGRELRSGAVLSVPSGAGIVRDSVAWQKLWARFAIVPNGVPVDSARGPEIDWSHELVVLVSTLGTTTDMTGPDLTRINRVVWTGDRVTIVLGPDSVFRRTPCCRDAELLGARMVAIPRTDAPVHFWRIVPTPDSVPNFNFGALASF